MSNIKTVVLFNGPPRSGKDTYAHELNKILRNSIHVHFAEILKNSTHRAFGLNNVNFDYFEDRKDVPCEELYNAKPRDCYIHMSEDIFKPLCGDDYFVKRMYNDIISKTDKEYILISDCGFNIEAKFLSKCDDVRCFYCILEREGHDFHNDSRTYIDLKYINKEKDDYEVFVNKENQIEKTTNEILNSLNKFCSRK